jgi:uncharacterized membrane protein
MEETAGSARGLLEAPAWFDTGLHWITLGIEAAGILVIMAGALGSTVLFAAALLRGGDRGAAYHTFRTRLALGILLGLEFLVAADIIGTVAVDPSLDSLLALALIVLIRTFLSFSLEVEIEGRWPWRKRDRREAGHVR